MRPQVGPQHDVPPSHCPHCGKRYDTGALLRGLDASYQDQGRLQQVEKLRPGDITFCVECSGPLILLEAGVRKFTAADLDALSIPDLNHFLVAQTLIEQYVARRRVQRLPYVALCDNCGEQLAQSDWETCTVAAIKHDGHRVTLKRLLEREGTRPSCDVADVAIKAVTA